MENDKIGTDPKLAAIKEIIFGDNIKAYDEEFVRLHEQIESQRTELDNTLQTVKKDFLGSLNALKKELKKEVEELQKETIKTIQRVDRDSQVDKKKIGKMFEDLGKKLQL